jgi:multimeric flavodoxin WrbA
MLFYGYYTEPCYPKQLQSKDGTMKIAIVYHSGYGHTAAQAKAVEKGARSVQGTEVKMINLGEGETPWADLDDAQAIIFGTPTYMGTVSAVFKKFMEDSSKIWMSQKWVDKIAAGFTNSASQSGDKLNTLTTLAVFAAQHSMIWVGLGLMPGNNSSKGSVNDLNRLGSYLGAMAQSNADQGPDQGPIASDLKTAEHLGQRVATQAARFK